MDVSRGITRRALLQGASATTAVVALGHLGACTSDDDPEARPPNVLLVIADDMRADFLRFAEQIQARLGAPGRTFTAARTNVSLCQPFRVGLLTAQRSSEHLVLGNGDTSRVPHDDTLGRWVQDAGYRTGLIGKYLNGAPAMTPAPAGWTTWRQLLGDTDPNAYERVGYRVHDGTTTTQPDGPELDYLRDEVTAFVGGAEPWFCLMTPTAPHHPYQPEPSDEGRWADLEWETPENADQSDKPSWYASLPPLPEAARERFRADARAQAEEISGLDRVVIEVLDSLPEATLANTVVLFTSDDGMSYGEHRSPYGASKNDFYEHNLLVPLIGHGPGFEEGTSTEPVSPEIDLAATIVAITGATASRTLDGLDLREVQDDPSTHAGRHLLHERSGGGTNNPNPYAGLGVSNATRKLMRWTGQTGTDRYEAYDLDTDPNEFENWAHDPTRRHERDALEAELDRLAPPPSLEPTLLYAHDEAGATAELVTDPLSPAYLAVLVVDVFTALAGAEVADPVVAGDGIDRVELLASHAQVGTDGVRRRLLSFQARSLGGTEPITITAGDEQMLSSLAVTVTEYAYHAAVVHTAAAGGTTPTRRLGVTLPEPQAPDRPAHLAVLMDADQPVAGADGAQVLRASRQTDPPLGFATLWVASSSSPAATVPAATARWSAVASEIGT
jgi:N-acetylglucosamine-6-sulfatase